MGCFSVRRFYGRTANDSNNFVEKKIDAIKANVEGLQKISGERILRELKKILQGNFRFEILVKIIECGSGRYISKQMNRIRCRRKKTLYLVMCVFRFARRNRNNWFIPFEEQFRTTIQGCPDQCYHNSRHRSENTRGSVQLACTTQIVGIRDLGLFLIEHKHPTENIDELL